MENSDVSIENRPPFSESHIKWIIFTMLILYPLVGMGVDLVAPCLPAISEQLNISSSFAKNTITFYLFGYMLGNLIIGFLTDSLGRRKVMLVGFLFFILASILPPLITNSFILLISRFFQGFTIAAFVVSSRAILSDILPKEKLIRTATMLTTMWGLGPLIGPVIGGYIQFYFNWQMCFVFFALFGWVGLLSIVFVIPETHFSLQLLQFQQIKNNFITIMKHRLFIGLVLLMGAVYSLLIVFNTLGPFLIQNSLHYSSIEFGEIALFLGLTFLIGTFLCRKLLQYMDVENIFYYTISIFIALIIISFFVGLFYEKNLWAIFIPSVFMFLVTGIIYPLAMGKGLSLFRHLAGSCSAITNFLTVGLTTLTSFIVSLIPAEKVTTIISIYLSLMLISGIIYYIFVKPRSASF